MANGAPLGIFLEVSHLCVPEGHFWTHVGVPKGRFRRKNERTVNSANVFFARRGSSLAASEQRGEMSRLRSQLDLDLERVLQLELEFDLEWKLEPQL